MEISTKQRNWGEPVVQFSVFARNQVGRLLDVVRLLNSHNVHVLAITVLDTTDSAIIRLLVDDPDRTRVLFSEHEIPHAESEVLVVEIRGEGDMQHVLRALLEAEVNIHYMYSCVSRPREKSALVISLEDREVASQALQHRQFKVLRQNDLSR